jgi:phosphatidylserine/phosphatidylglycerophosphate/cardiolipin synthase-like enzyme
MRRPDATTTAPLPAAKPSEADRVADDARRRWFLSPSERGNSSSDIDSRHSDGTAWTVGNQVSVVVHGANYFRRLHEELCALHPGDRVYFADWRGDADQLLLPDGPAVGALLCDLARKGVEVRGLVWRSHSDHLSFSAQQNGKLGTELNEAGAEVLLDQRVRRFGSHHQKLFIIRHRDDASRDVAFVGGIDLCHGRRDGPEHLGDPQQQPMDKRYGDRAPWHDAALELQGPVVGDLLFTFTERWNDPTPLDRRTPYRRMVQRRADMPRHPHPMPAPFDEPAQCGPNAVQVLRTYGRKHRGYPFARRGERSVARAYTKAFGLAHSLIYIEDQYLWSTTVTRTIAEALRRSPELLVIAVVPRYPDADGAISGPTNRVGQLRALHLLRQVAPDRVGIFDIENAAGTPIYVHAKVCVVDDVWFTCGSDNINRRSWTNDSELTCAVLDPRPDERAPRCLDSHGDGARLLARDTRLGLWAEHLGRPVDDPAMLDPVVAFQLWSDQAAALDRWHTNGKAGPRPPGQARRHDPAAVNLAQRLVATGLYRTVADPDGRRLRDRWRDRF